MLVWRNDPVAFDNYPTFFLAHELAHQWWGQAVGWKNYHEQWLSEGFAQYFAVLYAGKERGDGLMTNLTRQMRKTAIDASPQGPVYLGYRLGHIRSDSRVFRALVYNKGAMVLHMLRRLVGDDRFFQGVRQFYTDWRFKKAGTDDFRAAMEAASGQDLSSFFEAWIYSAGIPELRFSSKIVGASELQLRFEHRRNVAPVPVTVTIVYANEEPDSIVVPVTERVVERTVPLRGAVREVRVNDDNAALAEIVR
jgi:aminopeptidase N